MVLTRNYHVIAKHFCLEKISPLDFMGEIYIPQIFCPMSVITRAYGVLQPIGEIYSQGSPHTGREWSAPTTT